MMSTVRSADCYASTRSYKWATKVACMLANVTGAVATVSGSHGAEFRAAPTGRVDLLDVEPPIAAPPCRGLTTSYINAVARNARCVVGRDSKRETIMQTAVNLYNCDEVQCEVQSFNGSEDGQRPFVTLRIGPLVYGVTLFFDDLREIEALAERVKVAVAAQREREAVSA